MKYNKLIEEFMYVDGFEQAIDGSLPSGSYDTSWDWLMPVVEKIGRDHKLGNLFGVMRELRKYSTLQGIDGVYNAVVEFIKTYNDGR